MKEPFIAVSVIIPVYNSQKYLRECLDSIVNQTLKNIEIILVDDGSTDTSGQICDEYAQHDSRIVAVHQKNSGEGAAREKGFKISKGRYIAFADNDDTLDKDFYERLYNKAIDENADICKGEVHTIRPNGETWGTTNKLIEDGGSKLFFFGYWWTAIYKKELLEKNNISVEGRLKYAGDILFQNLAVVKCNKLCLCNDVYYHWHRWPNSGDSPEMFTQNKMEYAIYTYNQVTDNLNKNKSALDKKGILNVYIRSINNLLGSINRLKVKNDMSAPFEQYLSAVSNIYKKCPYRASLKNLMYERVNINFLNINFFKDHGIKIPRIFLAISGRYKYRRRFIKLAIKILVNKRRYKKFKREPHKFFEDSKSGIIRLIGSYYK